MLNSILVAETKIARKISAHGICIKNDGVEKRRQRIRKRRLAATWQPHNENFALHF